MNEQMHMVETNMGEIGKRCNTRILEKKGSNLRAWSEDVGAPSTKIANRSDMRCLQVSLQILHAMLLQPN